MSIFGRRRMADNKKRKAKEAKAKAEAQKPAQKPSGKQGKGEKKNGAE